MENKVEEVMKQSAQQFLTQRPPMDPSWKSMDLCISVVFQSQVRKQYFHLMQEDLKSHSFERVISALRDKYQGPSHPINIVLFKNQSLISLKMLDHDQSELRNNLTDRYDLYVPAQDSVDQTFLEESDRLVRKESVSLHQKKKAFDILVFREEMNQYYSYVDEFEKSENKQDWPIFQSLIENSKIIESERALGSQYALFDKECEKALEIIEVMKAKGTVSVVANDLLYQVQFENTRNLDYKSYQVDNIIV